MHPSTLLLLAGALAPAAAKETIHSVLIFTRHGDRPWKGLPPHANTPPTFLTPLGQQQIFRSGAFYRDLYVRDGAERKIEGIDGDLFESRMVYAEAPDQALLATTGAVFLQGLYPPTGTLGGTSGGRDGSFSTLSNGTTITGPMNNYQYSILHTTPSSDPNSIWLKGDDSCPARDEFLTSLSSSQQLKTLHTSTLLFYQSFNDIFAGVLPAESLSFENAYAIYDYINVGVIHNSTIAARVSTQALHQLRTLADVREYALNGGGTTLDSNRRSPPTDILSISGRTLARRILTHLTATITSRGTSQKLTLLVGSYDSLLAFFTLAQLPTASADFTGLPEYAASMVFELFSTNPNATPGSFPPSENDLHVRFLFRNGSDTSTPLLPFPLFLGQTSSPSLSLPFPEFKSLISSVSIPDTKTWCVLCASSQPFCTNNLQHPPSSTNGGITTAIAGVIGAATTLAAVILLATASFLMLGITVGRRRQEVGVPVKRVDSEKSSIA